jgi:hypothetical protein
MVRLITRHASTGEAPGVAEMGIAVRPSRCLPKCKSALGKSNWLLRGHSHEKLILRRDVVLIRGSTGDGQSGALSQVTLREGQDQGGASRQIHSG